MSVNRLLANFVTTQNLLLKINLVSIGVLMIIVSHIYGAAGELEPQPNVDPTIPTVSIVL